MLFSCNVCINVAVVIHNIIDVGYYNVVVVVYVVVGCVDVVDVVDGVVIDVLLSLCVSCVL